MIASKLKVNKTQQNQLRAIFKNCSDKLSYHDLFGFLEHTVKIQMADWEKNMLEDRLDQLGMAFIEFNEFNEFTVEYGLDWGEPVKDFDLEAQLEEKLNLSYKDYELKDSDYFNGCKSILMSEKAALARVTAIVKELGDSKRFVDNDFGPKDQNDLKGSTDAIYKEGKIPTLGYPEPETIAWLTADEICEGGPPPQFIDAGAGAGDVKQGTIGDCWFVSALSVLVTRDELLTGGRAGMKYDKDMIIDKETASSLSLGVWPSIFHRHRLQGIYVLRFFKNFEWIYVIVDDRLPVDKTTKKLVFGKCINQHELWVPLIEKAYAKLHGCYEQLISGYIDEGIFDLTGFQPEKILIRNEKTGEFPHKNIKANYGGEDGFWKFLVERDQDNCLMGCSIKG